MAHTGTAVILPISGSYRRSMISLHMMEEYTAGMFWDYLRCRSHHIFLCSFQTFFFFLKIQAVLAVLELCVNYGLGLLPGFCRGSEMFCNIDLFPGTLKISCTSRQCVWKAWKSMQISLLSFRKQHFNFLWSHLFKIGSRKTPGDVGCLEANKLLNFILLSLHACRKNRRGCKMKLPNSSAQRTCDETSSFCWNEWIVHDAYLPETCQCIFTPWQKTQIAEAPRLHTYIVEAALKFVFGEN